MTTNNPSLPTKATRTHISGVLSERSKDGVLLLRYKKVLDQNFQALRVDDATFSHPTNNSSAFRNPNSIQNPSQRNNPTNIPIPHPNPPHSQTTKLPGDQKLTHPFPHTHTSSLSSPNSLPFAPSPFIRGGGGGQGRNDTEFTYFYRCFTTVATDFLL